jgi:hypothetical protein
MEKRFVIVTNPHKGPRFVNTDGGQVTIGGEATSQPIEMTEAQARDAEEQGFEVEFAPNGEVADGEGKPLSRQTKAELTKTAELEGVETVLSDGSEKPFAEGTADQMREAIQAKRDS